MRMLLMGNEAIARGAVEGGVQVVAGYPGTPSSEVLGTLAALATDKNIYVEWSVNEKAALEVAAGASYAGARAMVTMKQVGLNVAADPLMTLAYIGVKGGLVLVVADDPGPHSSQNEQDTRKFAAFAKLPVLDPATPAEAKEMARQAFLLSEQLALPVILRPVTRVCHVCQDVEADENAVSAAPAGRFEKSPGWTIFPGLAANKHVWLNRQQETARRLFNSSPFNNLYGNEDESSRAGVIACGVSFNYVMEAMQLSGLSLPVLKTGTPYPLPEEPVLALLRRVDRVLVVEELEPVVEEQVIRLAWQHGLPVRIAGKHDGFLPREGEFSVDRVQPALTAWLAAAGAAKAAASRSAPPQREGEPGADRAQPDPDRIKEAAGISAPAPEPPPLPVRPPVLCAGCPHRASFYAFKKAAEGKDAVFTGDIGCYTLGNAPPLNTVDTCLCMGASVNIAAGLYRVEPERPHVAFLGDSTFFHTGLPGLINAVYNNARIVLVVLDNRTTAMTGHQPHPGLGRTAMGVQGKELDIARLAAACGVEFVRRADPYDLETAINVAAEALAFPGPAVVVMQRECVAVVKSTGRRQIDPEKCLNCRQCIEELGCPAIFPGPEHPEIKNQCNGCGICAQVCPAGAIGEAVK